MREHKYLFTIIFFLLIMNIVSQEYHIYEENIVFTIYPKEIGRDLVDFYIDYPQGPTGIAFDNNGSLYISDAVNESLIVFNNNYQYQNSFMNLHSGFSHLIEICGTDVYGYGDNYFTLDRKFMKYFQIHLIDKNWNPILPGYIFDFSFNGNAVSIVDEKGECYQILDPCDDVEANNSKIERHGKLGYDRNILSNTNTFSEIINKRKKDSLGLRIYSVFILSILNYEGFDSFDVFRESPKNVFQPINPKSNGVYYLNGNCSQCIHWYSIAIKEVYIFKHNYIIDTIHITTNKTFPAIHPSGDIYFLDYDDKAVYLYRIKNVWDPEGREAWYRTNAYVTAKELKLRDRGSLDGAQIGMLEEWQRVEIVDRAKASTNIAGVEGRWCKVKTMDGRVGWAFGGYLKEDED